MSRNSYLMPPYGAVLNYEQEMYDFIKCTIEATHKVEIPIILLQIVSEILLWHKCVPQRDYPL